MTLGEEASRHTIHEDPLVCISSLLKS